MAIVRVASALRNLSVSVPLESVHSGMGANLFERECSFRVWAPNAVAVSVCVWRDERMSQVALAPEQSNSSYWSVDVADVVAGQPYQYWGYWWPNPDQIPQHQNIDLIGQLREIRFSKGKAVPTAGFANANGISMRNLVRDINWFRWHNPALRSDTLQFIHEDRENTVLAFKRWHESGNIVVVVVNLSDRQWQEYDYGIDLGGEIGWWSEIFNSQSPEYDGWNDSGNYGDDLQVQADGKLYMNLPKWSILIFRKQ